MSNPHPEEIRRFFADEAPKPIREAIEESDKNDILAGSYPYDARMKKKKYEKELEALQVELVKLQRWMTHEGARIAILFEGRDAAGKGGVISRLTLNLNPRVARIVALSAPSEREQGQWYFQRYVQHLPADGEMSVFDRSWYNRGVVEKVFGFTTDEDRELFFRQVNEFEEMLVEDGVHLRKVWLNVGRAEQLRRFLGRANDPLKQWKLSGIDVKGLSKWDEYSHAIHETLTRTHTGHAPWTVVRAEDKRRARLAVIHSVLASIDYAGRDDDLVKPADPKITGGPEMWVDENGD